MTEEGALAPRRRQRLLETIHSRKSSRLKPGDAATLLSKISVEGSRFTSPAREEGPESTKTSSSAELSRASQPCVSLSHRNSSASPSPLKTGSVLPPSRVNTSNGPSSFLATSHQDDRERPPDHLYAFLCSVNSRFPVLHVARPTGRNSSSAVLYASMMPPWSLRIIHNSGHFLQCA